MDKEMNDTRITNDEAEKKRLTEEKNQLIEEMNRLIEEKNQLIMEMNRLIEEKDQLAEKMKAQEERIVFYLLRNNALIKDIVGLVEWSFEKLLLLLLKKDSRWKFIRISYMSVRNNLALFLFVESYHGYVLKKKGGL